MTLNQHIVIVFNIHPNDWSLLGYKLCGLYWYDTRGTQGVRSMGNICSRQHQQIIKYTDEVILPPDIHLNR